MNKIDPAYAQAWKEYRKRNYIFWGAFLGFPFFGIIVSIVWEWLFSKSNWIVLVFLPYMAFYFHAGVKRGTFKCPRCEHLFHARGNSLFSFHNPYTGKCMNCGLPKYAPCDPGEEQKIQYLGKTYRYGAILDVLYWPLLITNPLAGLFIWIKLFNSIEQEALPNLLPLVILLNAITLVSCFSGIFAIPRSNYWQIIKKSTTKLTLTALAVLLVAQCILVYKDILTNGDLYGAPLKNSFSNGSEIEFWMVIQFPLQSLFNVIILFVSRTIRINLKEENTKA